MSVTLNEPALRFLLEDPAGPVGLDLRRRSDNILPLMRERAQAVLPMAPADIVDYDIFVGEDGLVSVFGYKGGRWADYLAAKAQREFDNLMGGPLQIGNHA
jgi:hypothetical protein